MAGYMVTNSTLRRLPGSGQEPTAVSPASPRQSPAARTGGGVTKPQFGFVLPAIVGGAALLGALTGSKSKPSYDSSLGVQGAINPPAQIEGFYRGLMGNRLRTIESQAQASRQAGLNALEARGLGQSSEVGRTLGAINTQAMLAGQEAQNQVQALRYAQFQSGLDFERQMSLAHTQDKPWWQSALTSIGGALGNYYGYQGFGNALGSIAPGQASSQAPWVINPNQPVGPLFPR
jgi:hypothetical protein